MADASIMNRGCSEMTSQSRKHRGLRSQLVVANYLKPRGFPHAESAGAGRPGVDVLGLAGVSLEVKARASFEPQAWMRQAQTSPGLPLVCFRPNGVGETRISEWPCIVRLADLVTLLRASGYGDELPTGIRLPLGGVLREADPIEPWNQHIGDDS